MTDDDFTVTATSERHGAWCPAGGRILSRSTGAAAGRKSDSACFLPCGGERMGQMKGKYSAKIGPVDPGEAVEQLKAVGVGDLLSGLHRHDADEDTTGTSS